MVTFNPSFHYSFSAFQIVQVADPPFLYNAYTFTVMANDTQGLTSISQMTINVTETTNDSPHLTTLPDTVILMENSTVGTVIYQVGSGGITDGSVEVLNHRLKYWSCLSPIDQLRKIRRSLYLSQSSWLSSNQPSAFIDLYQFDLI